MWFAVVDPAVEASEGTDRALNSFDQHKCEAALFAPGSITDRTVLADLGEGFVCLQFHRSASRFRLHGPGQQLVREPRHRQRDAQAKDDAVGVNVLPAAFAGAIQHCGTASGRAGDKFAHTRLTSVAAQKVRVPVIEQGVVHYECRVVHTNEVIPANLAADIKASAYADGDFHRVYFGEVLAAYAAPDAREKLRRPLL